MSDDDGVVVETRPWYDSKFGFEKALKQGLEGLKEIAKARGEAGYGRKERMGWWIILKHFVFDECGNTMVISENPPDYYSWGGAYPPDVITKVEWQASDQKRPMSYTMGGIPPTDAVCPRCLEGWTVRNVADYMAKHSYSDDSWTHYHKRCYDMKVTQSEIEYFDGIFKRAHLDGCERRLIPAEYPDRPTAPWFIVETDLGPVKIGYRRRVISIEWPHAEGLKEVDGKKLFEDQSTTKDRALVHAWGEDKAVEYLQKLMGYYHEEEEEKPADG